MQKLKNFFLSIWYYFFPTDLMRFENQLEKEAKNTMKKRVKLKSRILKYVKKHYGINGNSKYIRAKGHNPKKIKMDIDHTFHTEMLEVSLYITPTLKFSC